MGKINNESSTDRFKRLATLRTNAVLNRLRVLGNCSNRQVYDYTKEDIDKIFAAIDQAVKESKSKFHFPKQQNFKL
jgi:hypothetical protein